ncbi:MAG: hypothetical protein P1S60_14240, partial [Anaerolineae bacterium]|nr:hypothetical protein [Anaerolineae bacterium]
MWSVFSSKRPIPQALCTFVKLFCQRYTRFITMDAESERYMIYELRTLHLEEYDAFMRYIERAFGHSKE